MTGLLNSFDGLDFYRDHFMDKALWSPYVQLAGIRQNLDVSDAIAAGIAGTFPTFMVGKRWVVKFFGKLFNGLAAYQGERWVYLAMTHAEIFKRDPIQAPELIAFGELGDVVSGLNWPWPYLVFSYLPGISIGQVFDQIGEKSKIKMAYDLGKWVRRLHSLDLSSFAEPQPGWEPYQSFLDGQKINCSARHAQWGSLPQPLQAQIEAYVASVAYDDPFEKHGHLIHADIHPDHLVGELIQDEWRTRGVIDFGDARIGNFYYELAAVHLELFGGDKRLLRAFLDGYGLRVEGELTGVSQVDFSYQALSTALLHQFNVFEIVAHTISGLAESESLDQLADSLFNLNTGVVG